MGLRPRIVDAPGGPLTLFETDDADRDLDEAIAADRPAPYGRVLWSSGPCVGDVVAAMPLAGRAVLEIGCGTGFVSLVALRHGARVLATDVDEGALAAVRRARDELDAPGELQTALLDVRGTEPLPAADVVVIADLLYEELLAVAVARRVAEARGRGSAVVVGDPGRVFRGAFSRLLAEAGHPAPFRTVRAGPFTADVMVLGGERSCPS